VRSTVSPLSGADVRPSIAGRSSLAASAFVGGGAVHGRLHSHSSANSRYHYSRYAQRANRASILCGPSVFPINLYGPILDAGACMKKNLKTSYLTFTHPLPTSVPLATATANNSAMGVVIMPTKDITDGLEQLHDLYQAVQPRAIK
jgi:hypothetical protein